MRCGVSELVSLIGFGSRIISACSSICLERIWHVIVIFIIIDYKLRYLPARQATTTNWTIITLLENISRLEKCLCMVSVKI